MATRSPRWIQLCAALVLTLTAVVLLRLAAMELSDRRLAARDTMAAVTYNLPPSGLLPVLSCGYNEVAADLLWITTISYFAEQVVKNRDYTHLKRYTESTLALDPRFKAVYRYTAPMMLTRGSKQTNEDVLYAIDLLDRGRKLWPNDWRFPLTIGTYYMFELKTRDKQQKQRWRRKGADYIREAALVGADIPWLPSLAAKIYSQQGQRDLAIRHLQEMYLATKDERIRDDIRFKLRQLNAQKMLNEADRTAKEFERRYKANPLGFVPEDLFVLLGLDPLAPFSLEALLD